MGGSAFYVCEAPDIEIKNGLVHFYEGGKAVPDCWVFTLATARIAHARLGAALACHQQCAVVPLTRKRKERRG